jgi:hypothetical protein
VNATTGHDGVISVTMAAPHRTVRRLIVLLALRCSRSIDERGRQRCPITTRRDEENHHADPIGLHLSGDPARTTPPSSVAAQTADPAAASEVIAAQISKLREAARARDSLSVLADSASGASREFLDELIAQRDEEVHDGVISLAEEIESDQRRGADVTGARALVAEWLHGDWPLYANQLERRLRTIVSLGSTVEQVTGPERLAIESQITQRSERLVGPMNRWWMK